MWRTTVSSNPARSEQTNAISEFLINFMVLSLYKYKATLGIKEDYAGKKIFHYVPTLEVQPRMFYLLPDVINREKHFPGYHEFINKIKTLQNHNATSTTPPTN